MPGQGIGKLDLHDDGQRAQAETTLLAWRGLWIGSLSIEENGSIRFQMHADIEGRPDAKNPNWYGIRASGSSAGGWTVSAPPGRLDSPSAPAIAS